MRMRYRLTYRLRGPLKQNEKEPSSYREPGSYLNLLNGSVEAEQPSLSARGFGNKGGGFTFKFSTRQAESRPLSLSPSRYAVLVFAVLW